MSDHMTAIDAARDEGERLIAEGWTPEGRAFYGRVIRAYLGALDTERVADGIGESAREILYGSDVERVIKAVTPVPGDGVEPPTSRV